MTNEELVKKMMNFSQFGALSQVFIMQSIENYCDLVISEKEELLKEEKENIEKGEIAFVSLSSWVGVAEEIKEKIVKNKKL